MDSAQLTREDRFRMLLAEWHDRAGAPDWNDDLLRLTDEWRAVAWTSGGKTLLAALGLQYQEVALCRALAWLLDPSGGHHMGRELIDAFFEDLGLPVERNAPVSIRVEESRSGTRADIVLRVGGQTVIIEAKVFAGEQPEQADRLSRHWADDTPVLVFLTRTGHLPSTAKQSADLWVARAWRDLARLARDVADREGLNLSAGAREYIETIGAL
ncbi:PD-(D/E)XK nuclease family protein [Demequina soli]|uniref:PD-(D/E)XK nuclease family protein n=1 Tax=Demequina soli TaxID=1638987 RepID=UPI00078020E6|nr:PD-(D/E)XK nuclease family protein [Demequina soli]